MKLASAVVQQLETNSLRLDASFYASDGVHAMQVLQSWKKRGKKRTLSQLIDVCLPGGIFIPGRFRRVYVSSPLHGVPWLSPSDMLKADLSDLPLVSIKYTPIQDVLRLKKGWLLLSRSGAIGNLSYVRKDMVGLIGSDDIIRIVADDEKITAGYLFAVLSSSIGKALIQQQTYGAVIQHIESDHIRNLPIPRIDQAIEEQIHDLIEGASTLRCNANSLLVQSKERFHRDVLGLDVMRMNWNADHVDAFAVGRARFDSTNHRLDAFHYVGYTGEAADYLPKTQPMGDLVDPYQPNLFKRPYTGPDGIPFLSGVDLYNSYPKPHMYISRKMKGLESYRTAAGTILVQHAGQRYGLFGQPTILLKHLDGAAVSEHLFRVYTRNPLDRGFVYIWLSTEVGRRMLLKQSFGTSMGLLANESFRAMPIPVCPSHLRYSFEIDVQNICEMRERAIELEDQAQRILAQSLKM